MKQGSASGGSEREQRRRLARAATRAAAAPAAVHSSCRRTRPPHPPHHPRSWLPPLVRHHSGRQTARRGPGLQSATAAEQLGLALPAWLQAPAAGSDPTFPSPFIRGHTAASRDQMALSMRVQGAGLAAASRPAAPSRGALQVRGRASGAPAGDRAGPGGPHPTDAAPGRRDQAACGGQLHLGAWPSPADCQGARPGANGLALGRRGAGCCRPPPRARGPARPSACGRRGTGGWHSAGGRRSGGRPPRAGAAGRGRSSSTPGLAPPPAIAGPAAAVRPLPARSRRQRQRTSPWGQTQQPQPRQGSRAGATALTAAAADAPAAPPPAPLLAHPPGRRRHEGDPRPHRLGEEHPEDH